MYHLALAICEHYINRCCIDVPTPLKSAKADTSRSAADNKSRAASEPPELAPHSPTLAKKVTALKNSLVSKKPSFRLGSAKRPDSTSAPSAVPAPTSTVAETSDEVWLETNI